MQYSHFKVRLPPLPLSKRVIICINARKYSVQGYFGVEKEKRLKSKVSQNNAKIQKCFTICLPTFPHNWKDGETNGETNRRKAYKQMGKQNV